MKYTVLHTSEADSVAEMLVRLPSCCGQDPGVWLYLGCVPPQMDAPIYSQRWLVLLGGAWCPDLPTFLKNLLGHPAVVLLGLP